MTKRRKLPITVDRLLESIRQGVLDHVLIDRTQPGLGKEQALRQLLTRASELLAVSNVTARPDGFAARTPGNGSPGAGQGAGMTMLVPVDGDAPDRVPTSSTESAAVSIITQAEAERRGAAAVDPLRGISYEVLQSLRNLDSAVKRLGWALDRWDRLRSTVAVEDAPQCYVASVIHRLPWDEAWSTLYDRRLISTRFEGVLDQPWPEPHDVCRWAYDWTRRTGRLPTKDECLEYLRVGEGGVRVRITAVSV